MPPAASDPVPPGECRFPRSDPEPRAHLGILLVHGIGDHQEGQTLTSFGEPLLDWMRDWLRGDGKRSRRGVLTVGQARLKTDGDPAYALAEVAVVPPAKPGDSSPAPEPLSERWLICEGWWGGSVQAPASWNLLLWMWSRTPLLVYWHFYLSGVARGFSRDTPWPILWVVPAFLLASLGQLAVSIAMVLWLIPIGPWRQGVLSVVRTLTLTLGDSYVLIGQEIQHAALLERVRRSLKWLAERTDSIVVVAHSQGGAIAHEALLSGAPSNVASFISLGSGLEKLQFLRTVLDRPTGLVASALILPGCLLTFGMARIAWNAGVPWETGLAWVCVAAVFILGTITYAALGGYRDEARASVDVLTLPPASGIRWLDLFATRDAVPMGRGSLLRDASFLKQSAVFNEGSFLRDHLTYFTNDNDCLHHIWQHIAAQSRLALFQTDDVGRLQRFSRLHVRFGRLFAFSRLTCILATFVLAVLLRHELIGFGKSAHTAVTTDPLADWLKPVNAVADVIAGIVRWWPGAAPHDTLKNYVLGLALLLGGIVLWWSIFRAFWSWRRYRRWRAAVRGADVQQTVAWRAARAANLSLFALLGSVPLIIAVTIYFRPDLLTFESMGQIVARVFSLILLLIAFGFAAEAPLLDSSLRTQPDAVGKRLLISVFAPLLALFALGGAGKLWPTTVPPVAENLIFNSVLLFVALGWQIYAVWVRRLALGPWMTWLVALLPLTGAAVSAYVVEGISGVTYVAITALLIGGAFLWSHRSNLPQIIREIWRMVSQNS